MKAKVLANFRDKYTNALYNAGDVIEVSEERFKEIESRGCFVEAVKEKKVCVEEKTEE